MHDEQFSAATAHSLLQGYCSDFVKLAAVLAQTLEQAAIRDVDLDPSRRQLTRLEQGMRDLADALHDQLQRPVAPKPAPAPRPAAATPARQPNRPAPVPTAQPPAESGKPRSLTGKGPAKALDGKPSTKPRRGGSLQGTTASMPVLSVFQFLGRMRKSGTLHITLPDEELAFVMEHGCIAFATSNRNVIDERLGDLLVDADACTREALVPLEEQVATGSADLFGQLVIDKGVATLAQVLQALEMQVRRRFQRSCRASEAIYEFVEGELSIGESPFRSKPVAVA